MSIAVMAVVRPSRWLQAAAAALALAYVVTAWLVWQGGLGTRWPALLVACACLLGAAFLTQIGSQRQSYLIDVSGTGAIQLAVQRYVGQVNQCVAAELLPGSTLWPACLVLRLKCPGSGPVHTVVVMPDSVSREHFRCLSVAMRRIARMAGDAPGHWAGSA